MNAKIDKTQIFRLMKYDLKGHSRSQKMAFLFKNPFALRLSCYFDKNSSNISFIANDNFSQNEV